MAEQPTESTKDRILEEAVMLFAEKGFHGTSMRTLARKVGIKESSLYNHFAGKDAILAAILEYQVEGLKNAVFSRQEMDDYAAGRTDAVSLWLTGIAEFAKRLPPLNDAIGRVLHNELYLDERCRRFYLETLLPAQREITEIMLGDLQAKGLIGECDIPAASARYVSMMHGIVMENTALSLSGADEETVRTRMTDQIKSFLEDLK